VPLHRGSRVGRQWPSLAPPSGVLVRGLTWGLGWQWQVEGDVSVGWVLRRSLIGAVPVAFTPILTRARIRTVANRMPPRVPPDCQNRPSRLCSSILIATPFATGSSVQGGIVVKGARSFLPGVFT